MRGRWNVRSDLLLAMALTGLTLSFHEKSICFLCFRVEVDNNGFPQTNRSIMSIKEIPDWFNQEKKGEEMWYEG